MWLVSVATSDLADAIHRDLLTDRLNFDDLGWRGLWAYITAAPPGTAIHYAVSEGWSLEAKIAAEQLHAQRTLGWRFGAIHFQGGTDVPFPEPIAYPGAAKSTEAVTAKSWETASLDQLITPEVRALLNS